MADVSLIPFNNDPFATEIKTGSYTVLAGEYAYVSAWVQNDGVFSVDGDAILEANTKGLAAVSVAQTSNTTDPSYTVPAGQIFIGQAWASEGTYSTTVNGNTIAVEGGHIGPLHVGPSHAIAVAKGAVSGSATISGYTHRVDGDGPVVMNQWYDTGTSFTISGDCQYSVARYKKIT